MYRPPPTPPLLPHEKLLGWIRRSKNHQLIVACAVFLIIILAYAAIAQAATPPPAPTSPAAIATPTDTPTQDATLLATDTPTEIPTDTPTPSPTAKPRPTPRPTVAARPTARPTSPPVKPTPCPGINCNPWGYNFSPGSLIYNPPSNFCSYFNCIASFWGADDPGDGYVAQCQDGAYSQSGGESGACSYHGGVARPLYAH